MSTKATLITSGGVVVISAIQALLTVLLAIPPFLMGVLDQLQFGVTVGYAAIAAALVCMFASQLAKF